MRLPRHRGRLYATAGCVVAGALCLALMVTKAPVDWSYQIHLKAAAMLSGDGVQYLASAPEAGGEPAPPLTPLSTLDASQRYRVRRFAAVGERWAALSAGAWSTCLALHASLSHAHHVARQADAWSGPLSVALFAAGADVRLLLAYVAFLRRCRPAVRQRVSFHLVWPASDPPSEPALGELEPEAWADCGEDDERLLQRVLARQQRPVGEHLSYPQNLARNTARLSCATNLTVCPDVDMLPSPGVDLAAELAALFSRQPPCRKCAYVLPVFEVDSSEEKAPQNKRELRELVNKKKARPFHWAIFKANQKSLDPVRWLKHEAADRSSTATKLSVAYEFPYLWASEPVYVAASGELPVFDETFVGYGFTRNTQAYEMFASGWRFFALDEAFLVHWGLQTIKKRPQWRSKETTVNNRHFRKWTARVAIKYDGDPLKLTWTYGDLNNKLVTCPRSNCSSARTSRKAASKKKGKKQS